MKDMAARMAALEAALAASQASAPPMPARPAVMLPTASPPGMGYAASRDPAASARLRAAALLGRNAAPFAEAAPGPKASAPVRPGLAQAAPLNPELLERVLHGGGDAAHALRLIELDVMARLLGAGLAGDRASSWQDPMPGLSAADAAGIRGSAGLQALRRTISTSPEAVINEFNASIRRELETDVTGMPWSLRTYVERRVRFAADRETEERMMAILCRLHALHLAGPDNWFRVGDTIAQAFKSLEHYIRERDWQLAWCWLDTADPRPRPGMSRGLAQAAEMSAAVAFLREAHLLDAQRQAAAGRMAWPGNVDVPAAPRPRPTPSPTDGAAAAPGPGALTGSRSQRRRTPKAAPPGRGA